MDSSFRSADELGENEYEGLAGKKSGDCHGQSLGLGARDAANFLACRRLMQLDLLGMQDGYGRHGGSGSGSRAGSAREAHEHGVLERFHSGRAG